MQKGNDMATATKRRRRRRTSGEVQAMREEALTRATTGQSLANWPEIFRYFTAAGIPEADILPRVNVLTYRAWQAKGRQVRKGEKGCKVITCIPVERKEKDKKTGEEIIVTTTRPWGTTVFHVSQTDAIEGGRQ
jgi:hypothetical protein